MTAHQVARQPLRLASEETQIQESKFTGTNRSMQIAPLGEIQMQPRKTTSDSKGSFVLLALVLVFILCQSIRLFFKGFEIMFIDKHLSEEAFKFCDRLGRLSLPGCWLCLSHLNHFLLVLNSALNFVLYCCVGQRFRGELVRLFRDICGWGKWRHRMQ